MSTNFQAIIPFAHVGRCEASLVRFRERVPGKRTQREEIGGFRPLLGRFLHSISFYEADMPEDAA
ncbi:hypothetical protein GDI0331 [Gluconacetobacter diazotrophicus PA1 5]|uniref:Uncharacterized protein n=1 Tax=Gluconacetobacter diazotrophicus (strain ATCC 49037 / DSM 5601 / CCUG 37298 / CIP 103539 / LMG 7603 / PAl5) TaxID=272568 RepID=A9H511_GLUDA|nr:hypothetical protein GDI0331 [Gluconacetobacter diazotrophicus PA1 5]